MIYSRWSEAFDALKKTKSLTWESAGKFCPKTEWSLYHAEMIKQAEMEFELATKLKNDICKYSPLVMGCAQRSKNDPKPISRNPESL